MPTECNLDLFGFASVERRTVVAGFDGGPVDVGCRGAIAGSDGSGDRAHALSWFTSQPSSSMGRPANGQANTRPASHATPDHTAPFSGVVRRAASWSPSRVGGAQFARRHAELAAEGAVEGGQVGKPPAERDIGH
jgi:hypothetical protein